MNAQKRTLSTPAPVEVRSAVDELHEAAREERDAAEVVGVRQAPVELLDRHRHVAWLLTAVVQVAVVLRDHVHVCAHSTQESRTRTAPVEYDRTSE